MKYFIDGKYYFEALQVQDPPHYIQQCFQIRLTQIAYLFGLGQHLKICITSNCPRMMMAVIKRPLKLGIVLRCYNPSTKRQKDWEFKAILTHVASPSPG